MVYLRKGEGEVESLPQASEGDEGLARESCVWSSHSRASHTRRQDTGTGILPPAGHHTASVLTHPRNTPAWTCIHLTALSWKENSQDFTNLKKRFLLYISLLCNGNVSWMLKVLHGTIHARTFILKNIKKLSFQPWAKWGNKPTFHASTENILSAINPWNTISDNNWKLVL